MYVLNLLAGIVARAAKLDMPSFPIRIIVYTKMLDIVVKFGKYASYWKYLISRI